MFNKSGKEITSKEVVPDFLVFLCLVITLLVPGCAGNAFMRGQLIRKYCNQREIW